MGSSGSSVQTKNRMEDLKQMKQIRSVLIGICVILCSVLSGCDKAPEYETTLFQSGVVHKIDIDLSEADWKDLLEHPTEKTKYHADITIDGETLNDVSFATKGNSSLFFVAADPDSSRYSYKVNFGKFQKGQTFHGLNTLDLNNGFSDRTYMMDYLSYRMFAHAGVPSPLVSYIWLTVNGEDRGLYLAVEDESQSFLEREFRGKGVIYKPESKDMELNPEAVQEILANGLTVGGRSLGSGLRYIDDDPESYPDIFENAKTKTTEKDDRAVIRAMKALSEGTDLNRYLDTTEIIRYFAVHNFLLNYDSYTGEMPHNLVLHENNGRLSLIPWDYNSAFGTFIAAVGEEALDDPTDLINLGMDSPLIGPTEEERPMWRWIEADDTYRRQYHDEMDSFVSSWFESGAFANELNETYALLKPYVEKDPTAFYSAEEFRIGCETLQKFCERRAESIRRQLDGTLSSVSENQADQDKVNASDIDVLKIGGMRLEAGALPAGERRD